jgi:hypothetical protein
MFVVHAGKEPMSVMDEPGTVRLETYNDGLVHWHVVGSGANALCYDAFNVKRKPALRFKAGAPTCLWCIIVTTVFP